MPVRKFRSIDDPGLSTWRQPGDRGLARALASVWAFGRQLNPRRFTPGVRKFRSIEEMQAASR